MGADAPMPGRFAQPRCPCCARAADFHHPDRSVTRAVRRWLARELHREVREALAARTLAS